MKDVCKIVGIKMSQAQYWTRKGVVKADITGPTSQGKPRFFSLMNLFEFSLARELTKRGIEVIDARNVLEQIRKKSLLEHQPKELMTWRVMVDPLLVYFGSAFFLATLHEAATKGVATIWFGKPPPPRFMEDFRVVGFGEKIAVIVQYYPSALIVNLETVRRNLVKRLQEVG